MVFVRIKYKDFWPEDFKEGEFVQHHTSASSIYNQGVFDYNMLEVAKLATYIRMHNLLSNEVSHNLYSYKNT